MPNQTIDLITEQKFYTKEEITELTGLSIHTLNNWIKEFKPDENEIETGRQNRRTYSTNYLIRIFEATERKELINLVKPSQEASKDELEPSQRLAKDEAEDKTTILLLRAKDETIQELKSRVETLENELKEKNQQIKTAQELIKNQQTLALQQNNLFLESKKDKTGGLLSWFSRKPKEEKED